MVLNKIKISKTDEKIIQILNKNTRTPITRIAKKVRLSKDGVKYRIKRLVKLGVINKFYLDINYHKLGYYLYTVFFRLRNFNEKDNTKIIEKLCNNKYVTFVNTCSGNWDLWIEIYSNSLHQLDQTLSKVIGDIGSKLLDYKTVTGIKIYNKYKPIIQKNDNDVFYKQNDKPYNITKVDYTILKALELDSKKNVVEIAREINSTTDIVRYRLKKMVDEGLIVGFDIDIDFRMIGQSLYVTLIKLGNYSKHKEEVFAYYLATNKNVRLAVKVTGSQEVLLEVIAKDIHEFNTFIKETRDKFSEIFVTYEVLFAGDEHKALTVPYIERFEK